MVIFKHFSHPRRDETGQSSGARPNRGHSLQTSLPTNTNSQPHSYHNPFHPVCVSITNQHPLSAAIRPIPRPACQARRLQPYALPSIPADVRGVWRAAFDTSDQVTDLQQLWSPHAPHWLSQRESVCKAIASPRGDRPVGASRGRRRGCRAYSVSRVQRNCGAGAESLVCLGEKGNLWFERGCGKATL